MRIEKFIRSTPYMDVKNVDFTRLGLKKVSTWEKGRKKDSEYIDPNNNEVVVKKIFTDILDEDEIFIGLDIQFQWMNNDGEVVGTKFEKNYLDRIEAGEHLRKRRQRAIDKLMISARIYDKRLEDAGIVVETTLVEAMGILFDHYREVISKFVETGSDDFENALNSETDPQINGILNVVANPENNFTIKDSILFEI